MTNILLLQNLIGLQKVFDARLVRTNLVIKTDFDVKLISLNKLIISNVRKHLLVEKKNEKTENI